MDKRERRQTFQSISWFRDLYKRGLLNMDPPYQRRSVWNQTYRDYFVETVLLQYPAPTLFLHESMSTEGVATYNVVDGKQRLSTIFDFVDDEFPVREGSPLAYPGKFFSQLDDEVKKAFWRYLFAVEYLPVTDDTVLKEIFDRLNRNVARLTRQELRHAQFSGVFATTADELTDVMMTSLPADFPNIVKSSRRQMKDVELVSQLLLLLENGPQTFSPDELDDAYSQRDDDWSKQADVQLEFHTVIAYLRELSTEGNPAIAGSRLRNQADFYSLFGAVSKLQREGSLPTPQVAAPRLAKFLAVVGDEHERQGDELGRRYYDAARSASNDLSQRRLRIETLASVMMADTA